MKTIQPKLPNCYLCNQPIKKHTALLGAPGGLKCPNPKMNNKSNNTCCEKCIQWCAETKAGKICLCHKSNNKINFLQVGEIIECGACHPEKFPDCKKLSLVANPEFEDYKCSCICHQPNPKCTCNFGGDTAREIGHYEDCPLFVDLDEFYKGQINGADQERKRVLAQVKEKLKHITMLNNGNSPAYFVKDVLDILSELDKIE